MVCWFRLNWLLVTLRFHWLKLISAAFFGNVHHDRNKPNSYHCWWQHYVLALPVSINAYQTAMRSASAQGQQDPKMSVSQRKVNRTQDR